MMDVRGLLAARDAGRCARSSGQRASVLGGARSEAQVAIACEAMAATGEAWVRKADAPMRQLGPTRPDGKVTAVRVEAGGVDYAGVVMGGRAAYFDVKSSGSASLPLESHGTPTLRPSQRAELDAVARLGALAGVLIAVRPKPRGRRAVTRWWWVSWPAWKRAESAAEVDGRRSIGVDVLSDVGVECVGIVGAAPDWLTAALDAESRGRG